MLLYLYMHVNNSAIMDVERGSAATFVQ